MAVLNRLGLFFRSIRFRLAIWFVLILGIVMAAFSGFIYFRQVQNLRAISQAQVEFTEQRLRALLLSVNRQTFGGMPFRFPSDPGNGALFVQQGAVLAFIDPNGQVVQSWGPIDATGIRQLTADVLQREGNSDQVSPARFYVVVTGKLPRTEYYFLLAPVTSQDNLLGYFLLGDPVDPNHQLPRTLATLILGMLATLGLALAGGVWLADRAMRPVKTITQAAREIGESDLSLRLHLNRKDELGELADTFDGMLARLEAAFERQRQFTADASHELRTPLTIVGLEAGRALEATRSAHEYQRALAVIQSENGYMSRLVSNLLTLARMDAGQVSLQKEELDLSEVTLEVVERLAPLAMNNQVRLQAGELPELSITGDRQYLIQMLTNLVENAIKYSSGEDKRVEVFSGSNGMPDRPQAWVRVADHGPGIPAEHLPRLFDRFYQVDKARTRQSGDDGAGDEAARGDHVPTGTGLGLSIARWIARAHGGDIRVESEVGIGSIFEVTIPGSAPLPVKKQPH